MSTTTDSDQAELSDTIEVAARSSPTSPNATAVEDSPTSSDTLRRDSDGSGSKFSSPPLHDDATSMGDGPAPDTSDGKTPDSGNSSPLSSLGGTPSPPPPEFEAATALASLAAQPTSTTHTTPPAKPEQPQQQKQKQKPSPPIKRKNLKKTTQRLRRFDYEVECTHTGVCTCPMHASHPTAPNAPLVRKRKEYPHWSEWALGVKEWPESAMRSTLGKKVKRVEDG